jgi:hypothetical protein
MANIHFLQCPKHGKEDVQPDLFRARGGGCKETWCSESSVFNCPDYYASWKQRPRVEYLVGDDTIIAYGFGPRRVESHETGHRSGFWLDPTDEEADVPAAARVTLSCWSAKLWSFFL